MPIIESAKKALKQSRKRQKINLKKKVAIAEVKKKTKTAKDLEKAQSVLDKAAKTGYIHKNKAARLKSRLAKKIAAK
ncbi:MAG: 30S ribosomal protein S20 [bacterium]